MATISEALAIAMRHLQAGDLVAAEAIWRRIVAAEPACAEAWHMLGALAHRAGGMEEAVVNYRRAIAAGAESARVYNDLADVLQREGKAAESIELYQQALKIEPGCAAAYNGLGVALDTVGRVDEAVVCYRKAVALAPSLAQAHNNLGAICEDRGALDEAVSHYAQAVTVQPDYALAHRNLGSLLLRQGRVDQAIASCQRAVQSKPDYADAYFTLGNALRAGGRVAEANDCYRRAVELEPGHSEAKSNLGTALFMQGNVVDALDCFRRSLDFSPNEAWSFINWLRIMHFHPEVTLQQLATVHADFERRHGRALQAEWRPFDLSRDPRRTLRLGVLSPFFYHCPPGWLLTLPLEALRGQPVELYCYACRGLRDSCTERVAVVANRWCDASQLSDQELAAQIRADRIDILLEIGGYMSDSRVLCLARKPAPVQITWMAYEGTTGLSAIDYILADRYMIAPEFERYYSERVLRMPHGYVCYEPRPEAPAVGPLPALARGKVLFGSFSAPSKLNARVVRTWAAILHRVAESRLLLKSWALAEPQYSRPYREMFESQGIGPDRVEFASVTPLAHALEEYNRIDIALDTFPFSGSLTTCDALWMGVPVVTCPGETFASRHSLSHLSNVGLSETIACDLDDYVEIAVRLAHDLPRLAAIRNRLRGQMAASPLCDGPRFAANLMTVLRGVWRRWCAGAGQSHGPAEVPS